jgi:hypothetical protein
VAGGPQVHDEVGDFERQVAPDVVQHEVVARVVAAQHTPFPLHGVRQRDRLEVRRVRSNSLPVVRFLCSVRRGEMGGREETAS